MSRTNRNHGNHWRQMEGWVLGTEISRRWEKWGGKSSVNVRKLGGGVRTREVDKCGV